MEVDTMEHGMSARGIGTRVHGACGSRAGKRSSLPTCVLAGAAVLLGCARVPTAPVKEPAHPITIDAAPGGPRPAAPALAASRAIAPAEPLAGPFKSIADFCESWAAQRVHPDGQRCSAELPPSIEGPRALAQPEGLVREARLFQIGDDAYGHYIVLAIRTDRGWFFPIPDKQPDLGLLQQLDGPHRIHVEPRQIEIERGEAPALVFRYRSSEYASASAADEGSFEGEIRCVVAADGVPRCASRQAILAATGEGRTRSDDPD
jgi:hypothetical protein